MGFISGITPGVGDLFGGWKDVLSVNLSITEVQAKAVFSSTDFYTLPLSTGNIGIQTGDASPSFMAYALQTNRVRSDVRRGNRRLAGVAELNLNAFGVVTTEHLAVVALLGEEFSNVLTYDDEGNTLSYTPAVVSKELYQTPSGGDAYRYYATESEQAEHLATGVAWTPKPLVTTQVTRKRGRGV
jgi:hypothetical protein